MLWITCNEKKYVLVIDVNRFSNIYISICKVGLYISYSNFTLLSKHIAPYSLSGERASTLKVLSQIIFPRLSSETNEFARSYWAGFIYGRSTTDQILQMANPTEMPYWIAVPDASSVQPTKTALLGTSEQRFKRFAKLLKFSSFSFSSIFSVIS